MNEEKYMSIEKKIRIVKILLTLGALEFFGPVLRDTNSSHLLNPEWIGHARFHLMWNLMLWACLGVYNLYLLWRSNKTGLTEIYQVWAIQFSNAIAFWVAVALGNIYGGDVFDEKIHVGFMNINENILVFSVLSALLIFNLSFIKKKIEPLLKGDSK